MADAAPISPPPEKIRRKRCAPIATSIGILLAAGLIGLWGFSTRNLLEWRFPCSSGLFFVNIQGGVVHAELDQKTHYVNHDWEYERQPRPFRLVREWGENFIWKARDFSQGLNGFTGQAELSFHLGFPLAVLIAGLLLYRRMARLSYHPGCCANCDYDLRGTADGRCPECGTEQTPIARRRAARRMWIARARMACLMLLLAALVPLGVWTAGTVQTIDPALRPFLKPFPTQEGAACTAAKEFLKLEGSQLWRLEGVAFKRSAGWDVVFEAPSGLGVIVTLTPHVMPTSVPLTDALKRNLVSVPSFSPIRQL